MTDVHDWRRWQTPAQHAASEAAQSLRSGDDEASEKPAKKSPDDEQLVLSEADELAQLQAELDALEESEARGG